MKPIQQEGPGRWLKGTSSSGAMVQTRAVGSSVFGIPSWSYLVSAVLKNHGIHEPTRMKQLNLREQHADGHANSPAFFHFFLFLLCDSRCDPMSLIEWSSRKKIRHSDTFVQPCHCDSSKLHLQHVTKFCSAVPATRLDNTPGQSGAPAMKKTTRQP